uniref:hypothetical protein n=1 Tax=Prevotella nigrescens TaxID=28133 RepID=UPI0012DCFFB9|nr:hypothetical protein [Prevotella nigrescens]
MYSSSTVSREISRNRTETGKYVWDKADDIAVSRSRRIPGTGVSLKHYGGVSSSS